MNEINENRKTFLTYSTKYAEDVNIQINLKRMKTPLEKLVNHVKGKENTNN